MRAGSGIVRVRHAHRGAHPSLSVAREPARRVSLGLGVCHSFVESETTLPFVLKHLATVHLGVILSWGLLCILHPPGDLELEIITTHKDRVHSSGCCSFYGWAPPSDNLYWVAVFGHYYLSNIPPLSILAVCVLALYCGNPRYPQPHWALVRIGVIGAAAVPAIIYLYMAFGMPNTRLIFLPIVAGDG